MLTIQQMRYWLSVSKHCSRVHYNVTRHFSGMKLSRVGVCICNLSTMRTDCVKTGYIISLQHQTKKHNAYMIQDHFVEPCNQKQLLRYIQNYTPPLSEEEDEKDEHRTTAISKGKTEEDYDEEDGEEEDEDEEVNIRSGGTATNMTAGELNQKVTTSFSCLYTTLSHCSL